MRLRVIIMPIVLTVACVTGIVLANVNGAFAQPPTPHSASYVIPADGVHLSTGGTMNQTQWNGENLTNQVYNVALSLCGPRQAIVRTVRHAGSYTIAVACSTEQQENQPRAYEDQRTPD